MRTRGSWCVLGAVGLLGGAEAQEVVHLLPGSASGDLFGAEVVGGGDLDGDGAPDLLVESAGTHPPRVEAFSGRLGTPLLSWSNPSPPAAGNRTAVAGDFDADGFADVVIRGGGQVRFLSGKTGAPIHTFPQPGRSVAGGGDLDQDGFDDVLLGGTDRITALAGATGGVLKILFGLKLPGDDFGAAVSSAGDFDGDGWLDVLGGAPHAGPEPFDTGYAAVFSGADASLLFAWFGAYGSDGFGLDVAGLGDVDGDGRDDVAVNQVSGAGHRTLVFAGLESEPLFELLDPAHPDLGRSIAGGGDVDGDGTPDVLLGGGGPSDPAGLVRVHSGATGALVFELLGAPDQRLGASVAVVGDVDGNGAAEVVAGAPVQSVSSPAPGHALVLSDCVPFLVEAYGAGCAGAGGFVPALDVDGCPVAGGGVTLALTDGAGGAPAVLLAGAGAASTSVGGGCTLLVQPPFATFPLVLGGALPGEGALELAATLPPTVASGKLFLQAFVLDAASPIGASASNGVEVIVP